MRLSKVMLLITASITIVFVFRHAIINGLAKISFLRKLGVRLAMKIPFIRNKMIGSIFK
ncbi:hypothetical protein JCM21714_143 [Gracilibacillus boraciitolerans JCM 21714]|uniref:Uncharacterized protein n=1 Tax=Gracilibacillus boraciitolerans JCM 21714 TaxID=1298598 RepID=W4VDB9_9BACI|nr:hypothetical protein [Gracilibacillus boraciitolerans]GAE91202.1 hypothetical protein JCM21714_143 [Gracilibacillus boraciitolerans JCM 21714]